MSAISQSTPNLLGGVSQQPDPLKIPGQVREAENVLLDPTFGCKKRPPTKFIAQLATDIPKDATWFPIFRDQFERYIVAIYKDGSNNTQVKVWDADTGAAKTVNMQSTAADYLTVNNVQSIRELTINDYTLLSNSEKRISMDSSTVDSTVQEALVVINQIAYNTTYSIDFLKDGQQATQQKIYRAKKLAISPATFQDAGATSNSNCSSAGSQAYTHSDGSKTGLAFSIATTCNYAQEKTETDGEPFPTGVNFLKVNESSSSSTAGNYDSGATYNLTQFYAEKALGVPANNSGVVLGDTRYDDTTVTTNSGNITFRTHFKAVTDPSQPPALWYISANKQYNNADGYAVQREPWGFINGVQNFRYHFYYGHQPLGYRTATANQPEPTLYVGGNGDEATAHTKYVPYHGAWDEGPNEIGHHHFGISKWIRSGGNTNRRKWDLQRVEQLSFTDNQSSSAPDWSQGKTFKDTQTTSSNYTLGNGTVIGAGTTVYAWFAISGVQSPNPTITYPQYSVYTSKVTLTNAGVGWRQGDSFTKVLAGKTYTVTVEEEAFSYNYASENAVSYTSPADTSAGTLNVGTIVSSLVTSVNALSAYTAQAIGNVIYIKRTGDTRDFNIQTRGGTANNAMYALKGSVSNVALLPTQGVSGMILKIQNTEDSTADDYYVRFTATSGDIPGQGSWEETVKPGIPLNLNTSTMPHTMIREANGSFTIRPLSNQYSDTLYWASREVGDEESNPDPSFVGKTVKDMFFFMNRLGFLSSDGVVLSQPGDYFNFFSGSAISISDADPIDMTASATKPSTIKAALGTPKGLLLFAENSQFLLSSPDTAFGPATVQLKELSHYSYASDVKPLETGVSIVFSTEANTYSKVFEMAVDSVDNRPLVAENTRIIPEYIPPNLTISTTSPNNSFVAFGDDTDTLYTFKYFNVGNERSLAGWAKWKMPAPVKLFGFDHDTGYFVLYNGTSHILTKLEMLDDADTSPISAAGQSFVPRLDNYLFKSEVTQEASGTTKKKLRFPTGSYVVDKTANVIITQSGQETMFLRPPILSDNTGYYVEVLNADAAEDFILGLEYDMTVTLPSFFVTQDKRADRTNIPMVETAYLDLYYSGRYNITVSKTGYDDINLDLDVTPADIYKANEVAVQELTTKAIPVFSRGDYVTITVKASDPLPASITSYSWEGHYSNRGITNIR